MSGYLVEPTIRLEKSAENCYNSTMTEEMEMQTKHLELAMVEIDRHYGNGSIMRLGNDVAQPWPSISTGAYSLDDILGIGGLPLGRIVEIYGPESAGKSTICLSVIAEAQKMGGTCAFIDAEHAVDPIYAQALGVNMDDLLFSQPDYGEMALDIVDKLVRTGAVSVIVIDSVAALTPKAELEGDMEKNHVGQQPRMMAQAMRKIVANASKTKTLVLFTNQIREKIGIMFGNPETTPGGRALKFSASVRIDLRRKEELKDKNGNITGIRVRAKTIKNKMAPPLKVCEFDIRYGKGVDTVGCIADMAIERGLIQRKGAWYTDLGTGESLGQGRDNVVELIRGDNALKDRLLEKLSNE